MQPPELPDAWDYDQTGDACYVEEPVGDGAIPESLLDKKMKTASVDNVCLCFNRLQEVGERVKSRYYPGISSFFEALRLALEPIGLSEADMVSEHVGELISNAIETANRDGKPTPVTDSLCPRGIKMGKASTMYDPIITGSKPAVSLSGTMRCRYQRFYLRLWWPVCWISPPFI